jgi:hypothetical protein
MLTAGDRGLSTWSEAEVLMVERRHAEPLVLDMRLRSPQQRLVGLSLGRWAR